MKRLKYLSVILITLLCFSACKKSFLDVENTQNLYRQSYVKDLNSMQDFMNGVYVSFSEIMEEGMQAAYPELVADNLMPVSSSINALTAHYTWSQRASDEVQIALSGYSEGMNALWLTAYRNIRACSFIIDEIHKYADENTSKADFIKGQAYAMRAFLYFKLINTFAQGYKFTTDASHPGVPYITTPDITKSFSRQSVAEVYTGMINDLNNAIQILPGATSDTRFMNRNAAKAILARIYLFKEDFVNAKLLATEVANEVPIMSIGEGYPDDIFKFKTPGQTETLFQLSPKYDTYTTSFLSVYLREPSLMSFVATWDVAGILQENPNDIRSNWVTDNGGQWFITKFPVDAAPEVKPAIPFPAFAYYHCVIRSSEMFLTAAEAAARSGDDNTARTFLNLIRQRADPLLPDISESGAALLDSIYKERRKELSFEGLRMPDLQRWKMNVHRTDPVFPTSSDLPYPNEKAIAPIPLTDIKQAGIPQNPGY